MLIYMVDIYFLFLSLLFREIISSLKVVNNVKDQYA